MNENALAPVFKALADPTRRRVLDLLRDRPRTTGELSASFDVSRFAVMKHLGILEQAGLVVVRRRGRERWNHLNAVPLQQIQERWLRPFEAHWASALLRLKRAAETGEADMPQAAAIGQQPQMLLIEQELHIAAPRGKVFEALTGDITPWWGAPYLQSRENARAVTLEPHLGGRFFEEWGEGEGAIWGIVTNFRRNERIILQGSMAMNGAISGTIRFDLEDDGDGTLLKFRHAAVGEVSRETEEGYTTGWTDILDVRLRAWLERGKRMGLGHEPAGV